MRKFFWITIGIFALFLLALWSPWRNWNFNFVQILGITPPEEASGLQVSSLAGEVEVYVDGNLQGTANSEGDTSFILPKISPGDHVVRLVRKSSVANAFTEYSRLIKFTAGVDVILSYELGPTTEFSAGHLIYANNSGGAKDKVTLSISTNVAGATLTLNDVSIGKTPVANIDLDITKQQKLKVQLDGYETQEFVLLPEDQADRNKLKGLDLNVQVDLFLVPLQVNRT